MAPRRAERPIAPRIARRVPAAMVQAPATMITEIAERVPRVVLLDILAVVYLRCCSDRTSVPSGSARDRSTMQSRSKALFVVRNTCQSLFAPSIGSRSRLIMGEVVPHVSVTAVVLADGAPLPFAQIHARLRPRHTASTRLVQPFLFGDHDVRNGPRISQACAPDVPPRARKHRCSAVDLRVTGKGLAV